MRYHFSGVGGAGMNPLARLMAARGHQVQGSDRDFDRGRNQAVSALLLEAGVELLPQDGSAIDADVDVVVHSAAVEATTPEMVAARVHGVRCQPRPALLAEVVKGGGPGVAIAGTSGKSTVTGMVAWILRRCSVAASVLGGAALAEDGANHMGCFSAANADAPVIAEACESDGSLVDYQAGIGVIHNLSRDHGEIEELRAQFSTFAERSARVLVNVADAEAVAAAHGHPALIRYGMGRGADVQLEVVNPGPWRATGVLTTVGGDEVVLDVPQPGVHNLDNACAAVAVAMELGVTCAAAAAALADFPGVARRFQVVGVTESGITVVDDYAHNGAKIAAAVTAAQLGCERLVVVFQPHGYGPARFLRDELRTLWPQLLRAPDRLAYAPIYDAGGTANRSITSAELAADLPLDLRAVALDAQDDVLSWVADSALPGDTVMILGARDPRLGPLATALVGLL
ncbi:MAG: Mur ligase domain-containing protein [Planctomycetota bacterium]|jgi:UDP-N-acetylmuramate--alanine ligase